jgi:FkbM family methyltransferase
VTPRQRLGWHLSRLGINRGRVVRRLVRLGHPRLRSLEKRAAGDPLVGTALGPALRWLERGDLVVAYGLGAGLRMSMRWLPISHAHLGSIAFGNLESSVQEAMLRHVPAGGVFYDVGSNLGFFALLGAHMTGPEGRVLAFEPAPDNAAAIRHNAEVNGLLNVDVVEKAVAAAGGEGRLQVVDDQSWSKLEEYGAHPGTEQVLDVAVIALDEEIGAGALPPPDVVKIDVEGAEIAVLEGMATTLAEHRPAIICELHDTHREFVEHMRGAGYRVVNLEGPAPVEDEASPSAHALALPADAGGD